MPELAFDVDKKFEKTLADLVAKNNNVENSAELIKRAVATYKYFRGVPKGFKIQVVDPNGQVLVPDVTVP